MAADEDEVEAGGHAPSVTGKISAGMDMLTALSALYESARAYLTHLQASLEAMQNVTKLVNDLRSRENECLERQRDAYRACLDDAECRGLPPTACDGLKLPGNWAGQ